jgi:hypothetical protein
MLLSKHPPYLVLIRFQPPKVEELHPTNDFFQHYITELNIFKVKKICQTKAFY